MRLLNTSTFELHEFFDNDIPPYTILSHRWEKAEVTYRDMKDDQRTGMAGWSKVLGCCAQSAEDGFEYTVSEKFCSRSLISGFGACFFRGFWQV